MRCTGRVDLKHILYTIKSGADGVMIVGWRANECQFKNCNFTDERHIKLANRILASRGFGNQRVNMYWLSGAESEKFVRSVEDAYNKVVKLGPNPINLEKIQEINEQSKLIAAPIEWNL